MKTLRLFILGAGLWLLGAAAGAHSVDDVLNQLREQDHYIQMTHYKAPGFALEDPDGREVRLADFRGKVVILNFIYARCKEACPLQSHLLAKVQEQINTTLMRDQLQFVTIATDTEDAAATAQIMRGYGKAHGLDPVNWVFLYRGSGAPDVGIKVAKTYGLEFTPAADGEQMHGVVTHVIDQNGVLRARFHGLKFQPLHLTEYVNALVYPDHHGSGAGVSSPAGGVPAPERETEDSRNRWLMGALALSVPLLVLSWLVLRRSRAQRKAAETIGAHSHE